MEHEPSDEELLREANRRGLMPSDDPAPSLREEAQAKVLEANRNGQAMLNALGTATPGEFASFGQAAIRRFLDALLGAPQALGEGIALGAAGISSGIQSVADLIPGVDFEKGFVDRFDEAREFVRNEPIPSALINTPRVNTGDIIAGVKAVDSFVPFGSANRGLTGLIGNRFDQARLEVGIADETQRLVNPKATAAGELAGDVATIATLRAPFVRAGAPKLRAERGAATTQTEKVLPGATGAEIKAVVRERLDDTASKIFAGIFKGRAKNVVTLTTPITKKIGKGLGKAGGVGLEATTFALLNEGDPIKMFAFGAGAQSLGSFGLFLAERPIGRLAPFAASVFVAHEILKAAGPGDQNLFESKDFAIQTIVGSFALGLMGAITGAGRFRSASQESLPVFFDTITQTQRTLTREVFSELLDSKNNNGLAFRVLGKMATSPNFFNPDQTNSLGRALLSGKEGAFTKEVERLMKESPSFRKKMDEVT